MQQDEKEVAITTTVTNIMNYLKHPFKLSTTIDDTTMPSCHYTIALPLNTASTVELKRDSVGDSAFSHWS